MAKAKKKASKKASKKAGPKKAASRVTTEPVIVSGLAEAAPDASLPVADRTRFVPKAKVIPEAIRHDEEVNPKANGNRDFLIGVFAEPTSVSAAALELGNEIMTLKPSEAAKLVEAFLDKAANDPDLDVRRKMDGSEWVYLIKKVPAGAQSAAASGRSRTMAKKNGRIKKAVTTKVAKPAAKAAKAASGEKKPGVIATMLRLVVGKTLTREQVLDQIVPLFPKSTRQGLDRTFGKAIAAAKPSVAEKGATVTISKKDGMKFYRAVLAKA